MRANFSDKHTVSIYKWQVELRLWSCKERVALYDITVQ